MYRPCLSTAYLHGRIFIKTSSWSTVARLPRCCHPSLDVFPSHASYRFLHEEKRKIDMSEFPVENIRNFSIIAHVDHGKSTLADRLLEITGTILKNQKNEQVLDKLQVERERGITVKAQTASLIHEHQDQVYLLNLIDTPGHVDFNYEVSRSLSACQGVILLVDANQGVQAQTVANFYLAFEAELTVIPVLNKIDLKGAKPELVAEQLQNLFDIIPEDVIQISAKHGSGVQQVLEAVIEKIPAPTGSYHEPLRALLFDSYYDQYRGAVANIAVLDGKVSKGDRITAAHSGKSYEVQEVGILYPDETSTQMLCAGQVGYLYCNMKTVSEAHIGDTLHLHGKPVSPSPGFKPAKPVVFAGVFPVDQSEYPALRSAIDRLCLNDASVQVNPDSSAALGQGWRLGFLGLLHMDVFSQRLEQEHSASVIMTSPNVPYKVKIKGAKNIKSYGSEEVIVLNPCLLPEADIVEEYQEPVVVGTIISPDEYLGPIMAALLERRADNLHQHYIDNNRVMLRATLPLNEIVVDFFDFLKSVTSGYASFDYEDQGYRVSNLTKVDILLNGRMVEELAQITHISKARSTSKHLVSKLATTIPRQLFDIAIQARVGSKIICRENIKALRKDVLAKCYGGDITRKMKLLKRQTEGKKKMRMIGNIEIPKDTFIQVLKR